MNLKFSDFFETVERLLEADKKIDNSLAETISLALGIESSHILRIVDSVSFRVFAQLKSNNDAWEIIANEENIGVVLDLVLGVKSLSASVFDYNKEEPDVAQSVGALKLDDQPTAFESIEKGGAHVEYNNEVKNAWRAQIKKDLERHFSPKIRKYLNVLCLPGKDWVEVDQIYLEMGIRPENIWGIEREESAQKTFREKAGNLGCNFYEGNLLDFLFSSDISFDIISLDFLGPFSDASFSILQQINLSKKSVLITNFMGKREKRNTQKFFSMANKISHLVFSPETAEEKEHIKSESFNAPENVRDTRDNALTQTIIRIRGQFSHFSKGGLLLEDCSEILGGGDRYEKITMMTKKLDLIIDSFLSFIPEGDDKKFVASNIRDLLLGYLMDRSLPISVKRYASQSISGTKQSPYFSDVFIYDSLKNKSAKAFEEKVVLEVLNFLLKVLRHMNNDAEKSFGFRDSIIRFKIGNDFYTEFDTMKMAPFLVAYARYSNRIDRELDFFSPEKLPPRVKI